MPRYKLIISFLIITLILCGCVHGENESYDKNAAAEIVKQYVSDKYGLDFEPVRWILPTGGDEINVIGNVESFGDEFRFDVSYDEKTTQYYVYNDSHFFQAYSQQFFQSWLDEAAKEYLEYERYYIYGRLTYRHIFNEQMAASNIDELINMQPEGLSLGLYIIIFEDEYKDDNEAVMKTDKLTEYISKELVNCDCSGELLVYINDGDDLLKEYGSYADIETDLKNKRCINQIDLYGKAVPNSYVN